MGAKEMSIAKRVADALRGRSVRETYRRVEVGEMRSSFNS